MDWHGWGSVCARAYRQQQAHVGLDSRKGPNVVPRWCGFSVACDNCTIAANRASALCLLQVRLQDTSTNTTVPFIAVGMGLFAGEDYPCSGRVLLLEITRAQPSAEGNTWNVRHAFSRWGAAGFPGSK